MKKTIITRKYRNYFIKFKYKIKRCDLYENYKLQFEILQNTFPISDYTSFCLYSEIRFDALVDKDFCFFYTKKGVKEYLNELKNNKIIKEKYAGYVIILKNNYSEL